jgi:hypothetical protein
MHSLIHSPNDPADSAFDPKLTSRSSALDPKQTLAARSRLASQNYYFFGYSSVATTRTPQ